MEIKKESKFIKFFRRYGVLSLACVFCLVIALVVGLTVSSGKGTPVSTGVTTFSLPMENAVIVKDYSDERLQFNESLNRWEIHLSIDLSSENSGVFSVADGTVTAVNSNSLEGGSVEISHNGGFVSIYSSLSDNLEVAVGDKVEAGQKIGEADSSASNESKSGTHLHFTLLKDGVEVDPNNYLDLENK